MNKGEIIGNKYTLIKEIGFGGNATVWEVTDGKAHYALKILFKRTGFAKKYKRFREEVLFLKNHSNLRGIIPIIDSNLPKNLDKLENAWYVMPIATPIYKELSKRSTVKNIVACIRSLAEHLSILHEQGIVHRDIKPSNLYKYKDDWCFGDFGLVDYPQKADITGKAESVGPKWTMAPEMKRDAANSDGKKADVYSLAKTLWILLTGEERGFEGQYSESDGSLRLRIYRKKDYLVEIESLLTLSTDNDPTKRPTIQDFVLELKDWEKNEDDFSLSNLKEWEFVQRKLFRFTVPMNCQWKDIKDILMVLNIISESENLNHMMFPGGGGLDLDGAVLSQYEGCIELVCNGTITILSPRKLSFENVDNDPNWSYFWLEANEIDECGVERRHFNGFDEEIVEIGKGKFVEPLCWVYKHYDDKPLPVGSRIVSRMLKGSLVVFGKASKYNAIPETYDGRHGTMNSEEFRKHVEMLKGSYALYDEIRQSMQQQKNAGGPIVQKDSDKDAKEERKQYHVQFEKYMKNMYFKKIEKYVFNESLEGIKATRVYGIEIHFGSSLFPYSCYYLQKDYSFMKDKNIKRHHPINTGIEALFCSLDDTEKAIEIIEEQISLSSDFSDEVSFLIKCKRIYAPTHLFTLEELNEALLSGNDSHRNALVINEEGFLELIDPDSCSYRRLFAYPVRHESYDAYGNYVGKYTPLGDSRDDYIASLEGWCNHLHLDSNQYIDYYELNRSEEELISDINSIMKRNIEEKIWRCR